jgi:hypothetical protein
VDATTWSILNKCFPFTAFFLSFFRRRAANKGPLSEVFGAQTHKIKCEEK